MESKSKGEFIIKWYEAYDKIASELFYFGNENPETAGKRLFEKFYQNTLFVEKNGWINNFAQYDRVLDPVSLFASISNGRQSNITRTKLINLLLKTLDNSHKDYLQIDFAGCPTPLAIKIRSVRKENFVTEIWETFLSAYEKKENGISEADFVKLKSWYGLDIVSFTIFLFWIDSQNFIPLDKNTFSLLKFNGTLEKLPENYIQYAKLLTNPNSTAYRTLAETAMDSNKLTQLNPEEKIELETFTGSTIDDQYQSAVKDRKDFRIIGVSALTQCDRRYRKVLDENKVYHFYDDYKIADSKDQIEFLPNGGGSLYYLENNDTQLNISAIVGKNGSGKSTITELILAIINNLSLKSLGADYIKDPELELIKGVHAQLFFKATFLYMLSVEDDNIQLFRYDTQDGINYKIEHIPEPEVNLDKFFYTVFINYSQYALNCTQEEKGWLDAVYRKNDSYQMPIVLEPYREDGNIDINVQNDLVKNRLLANILSPEFQDETSDKMPEEREHNSANFLFLTEKRRAEILQFTINESKIEALYKKDNKVFGFDQFANKEEILTKLLNKFGMEGESILEKSLLIAAEKYIMKKLISIARTYPLYEDYIDLENMKLKDIDNYIIDLYGDPSHITHKLRQAINFIRFALIEINKPLKVSDVSQAIQTKLEGLSDEEQEPIYLIPPSFLSYKLTLTGDVDFDEISSGEKQKVYSTNSLLYQLRNINSVSSDKGLKTYDCVNIILDEIELYFHPEIQRTYIDYLRRCLNCLNLDRIISLNIIFVSHSPFILSDIPSTNILFLSKQENSEQHYEKVKTFGANIHELLIDGFFMNFTIGDFSKGKIEFIIEFYQKVKKAGVENENIQEVKQEYLQLKELFYFIIQNIGEEYIQKTLQNHVEEIEIMLESSEFITKQIHELTQKLDSLKLRLNA